MPQRGLRTEDRLTPEQWYLIGEEAVMFMKLMSDTARPPNVPLSPRETRPLSATEAKHGIHRVAKFLEQLHPGLPRLTHFLLDESVRSDIDRGVNPIDVGAVPAREDITSYAAAMTLLAAGVQRAVIGTIGDRPMFAYPGAPYELLIARYEQQSEASEPPQS